MTHIRSVSRNIATTFAKWSTIFYLQLLTFGQAHAQFGADIPAIPGTAQGGSGETRESVVRVINFILTFLALLALIFIIIGGFRILVAGGNDENVTKGRKTIVYAIIGLVIIFFARTIVGFFTSELAGQF